MDIFQEKHIVTLCGVKGCCPTLEFQEEGVLIKDDFGGQVRLTNEQWMDLVNLVEQKQFTNCSVDTHLDG